MKKQITVIVRKDEKQTVGIEFPIYRKIDDIDDHGYSWKIIIKVSADGSQVSIHKDESLDGTVKYEIEFDRIDINRQSKEFIIGSELTISSADEFNNMLHEMKKKIEKLIVEKME